MKYFVPINKDGKSLGPWCFDGGVAYAVCHPAPMQHANLHVEVGSGQELFDAMQSKLKAWFKYGEPCVLKDMILKPGTYYRRIARPMWGMKVVSPGICPGSKSYEYEMAISKGQLVTLMSRLQQICQTVHPVVDNYNAYGHEIRNLLILACTEVEAQWKNVLKANGVVKQDREYNTNDYVKLNNAMRLNEYDVSLTHYPWLKGFQPFKDWAESNPTQSLGWYGAYNRVKHDRENNFHDATLVHAINAVTACMIMLYAQVGKEDATTWRHEIAYFFELMQVPKWCPSEMYVLPSEEHAMDPVDYPFSV